MLRVSVCWWRQLMLLFGSLTQPIHIGAARNKDRDYRKQNRGRWSRYKGQGYGTNEESNRNYKGYP